MKIPMIYQLAEIMNTIPPSQVENERDFSLAGVISRAWRASFTVENLSMLVFLNKNKNIKEKLERTEKESANIFEVDMDILQKEIELISDYGDDRTDDDTDDEESDNSE